MCIFWGLGVMVRETEWLVDCEFECFKQTTIVGCNYQMVKQRVWIFITWHNDRQKKNEWLVHSMHLWVLLFDGTNHKKINLYDIRVREIHFNQLNCLRQLFCHYQADKMLWTGWLVDSLCLNIQVTHNWLKTTKQLGGLFSWVSTKTISAKETRQLRDCLFEYSLK